jgi:hypothetical protein
MNNTYVPGVCNIGEAEIKQRTMIGWVGLVVTIVYLAACYYFALAPIWRVVAFLPAALGATGFIQAWTHFCAGFGMEGVFNFGSELGKTDSVAQAEYRAKDKAKALWIFFWSLVVGIIIAIAAYYW